VAAVVIEVGAVTNFFGLGSLGKSSSSAAGSPGPNPNPFDEYVFQVLGNVTYTTGTQRNLVGFNGVDLCSGCPELPPENAHFSPPVAGLWFYFNVSDDGTNITNISHFSLLTSGPNGTLFHLGGIFCCYPVYNENVTASAPEFIPGAPSTDFAGYAFSPSIPNDGTAGYNLTVSLTAA
jgi:hypothetical protein